MRFRTSWSLAGVWEKTLVGKTASNRRVSTNCLGKLIAVRVATLFSLTPRFRRRYSPPSPEIESRFQLRVASIIRKGTSGFMHRLTALFLGTLFILLATAVPARSQAAKASLTGRVLDQNQASINGAQVTISIKDAKKQRTFVTQTDGSFRFD